jgi:2-C-methyl-D-erythritol 4-phosphate cytidylyltransferase
MPKRHGIRLVTQPDPLSTNPAQTAGGGDAARAGDVAAIVVAAGRGSRFGAAENKVLLPLAKVPIWMRAVEAMKRCADIGRVVMVVRACDQDRLEPDARRLGVELVLGGEQRYDSVRAGLDRLLNSGNSPRWVAVHDAARPLVTDEDVRAVVQAAKSHRAAILATPIRGTIKLCRGNGPMTTVDRTDMWEALTPQVFETTLLRDAYARHRGRPATDDAELVERAGVNVCLVPGSAENLKITRFEDLEIAEAILSRRIDP